MAYENAEIPSAQVVFVYGGKDVKAHPNNFQNKNPVKTTRVASSHWKTPKKIGKKPTESPYAAKKNI